MRIRWTELAARHLTHICDYAEKRDGPAAARRVALTIYQGVSFLTQFSAVVVRAAGWTSASWHFQGYPPWLLYRIRAEVIEINRICSGAQKWP